MRSLAMSLGELKAAARQLGFTKVKRDAEDAPWVLLDNWNGFWTDRKQPALNTHVDYYLDENRVLVMRITEGKETWYVLG
jgi:hypothetical protein